MGTTPTRWTRRGTTPSTPCRAAPAPIPASRNKEVEVVTRSDTTRTSSTSTTMTATEASCDGGELAQSVIWRPEIKLCTPGLGDMLLILELVKYALNVFS